VRSLEVHRFAAQQAGKDRERLVKPCPSVVQRLAEELIILRRAEADTENGTTTAEMIEGDELTSNRLGPSAR
jgi:hypothetical protein